MERIFVVCNVRRPQPDRERKLTEVKAYMYAGWEYAGWGSAPSGPFDGFTGFYFDRINDSSGPGFGAGVVVDRLRSGLHTAVEVTA